MVRIPLVKEDTGNSTLRFIATSNLLLHPIESLKHAQLFFASRLLLQARFYPLTSPPFTLPLCLKPRCPLNESTGNQDDVFSCTKKYSSPSHAWSFPTLLGYLTCSAKTSLMYPVTPVPFSMSLLHHCLVFLLWQIPLLGVFESSFAFVPGTSTRKFCTLIIVFPSPPLCLPGI